MQTTPAAAAAALPPSGQGSGGMAAPGPSAGSGGTAPMQGSGGMAMPHGTGGGGSAPNGSGGQAAPMIDAGPDDSGAPPAPAADCGNKPGMLRGKTDQMVTAAGVARTFILYAPEDLDPNKPAPIVIVPHGFTMSGADMFDITGYDKIADREGLVIAYPDGEGATPWNVGDAICGLGSFVAATGDDQSFMDEIIKFIEADQCVDHDHIFITGFSMGGYFSNETACVNPQFRAAGPHSGGAHDLSSCTNQHRPMIIFHFKSDSLIDYACGTDARDQWVAHNGCSAADPEVKSVMGGSCEYYKDCPADGQVAMCSFDEPSGGAGELIEGHAWSGGSQAGSGAAFAIPQTESATELGWGFFKQYAW